MRRTTLVLTSAALVGGAGVIHLAVAPAHFQEFFPFGLFFVGVGVAQLALAAALALRPERWMLASGLAGSLAVASLWLASRTVGLPIGPDPGRPEEVGMADLVCTSLEVATAASLALLLLRPPVPGRRVRRPWPAMPLVLLTAALSACGAEAGASGMPWAFDVAPPVAGQDGVSVTSLTAVPGPQPVRAFTLVAEPGPHRTWTFNGTVPGPELRVTQGDRVRVTLVNRLPESTTIHWHGVRLPNADDGVAGLTQNAVPPGHRFTYEFVARDTGTFWYHSHQRASEQIARGLFGALVVEPRGGRVAQDVDRALVLHDGAGLVHIPASPGQTVRLRVVNAVVPGMDGGPETVVLEGADYRVAALDAGSVDGAVLGPERIPLGMGQRVDLVFTVPPAGRVALYEETLRGRETPVERTFDVLFGATGARPRLVATVGSGPTPAASGFERLPLFDPTAYGTRTPNPFDGTRFDATFPLVLDEHPGFRDGTVQLVHTIDGRTMPQSVVFGVEEGWKVRLHIVNRTAEWHPIHLHGHFLTVLTVDGHAATGAPVALDTVLVAPHQTIDVAFVADNPGLWMLHCHVLLHAEMGMGALVAYRGVTTPYEMGERSGNMPE